MNPPMVGGTIVGRPALKSDEFIQSLAPFAEHQKIALSVQTSLAYDLSFLLQKKISCSVVPYIWLSLYLYS